MKKVAVYVRVSTDRQELEHQRQALLDFCDNKGWEVYKVYEEIASGSNDKRPMFEAMFDDAHKLLFEAVVFWDLTRFSRSGLLFTLQKLQELDNLNISFHSYQDKYITTMEPMFRNIVIAFFAEFAKIERDWISRRTKERLAQLKKKGVQLGRPGFPEEAREKCKVLLKRWNNPGDTEISAYKDIRKRVRYVDRGGKLHNISKGKISEIKREMEENGEL